MFDGHGEAQCRREEKKGGRTERTEREPLSSFLVESHPSVTVPLRHLLPKVSRALLWCRSHAPLAARAGCFSGRIASLRRHVRQRYHWSLTLTAQRCGPPFSHSAAGSPPASPSYRRSVPHRFLGSPKGMGETAPAAPCRRCPPRCLACEWVSLRYFLSSTPSYAGFFAVLRHDRDRRGGDGMSVGAAAMKRRHG